jgi:phage-related protein
MVRRADEPRPLIWRGTSKTDFLAFPRTVQREMGYALFLAQMGERHPTRAKTLGGLGGGDGDRGEGKLRWQRLPGGLYGALRDAIYVLHAFQKKSKKGIATPKAEIDLIEKRLKDLIKEKEGRQ